MLIAGFPAGSFAANCYLIAAGRGEPCLIVDPGQDAEPDLKELLRKHRLEPAAVLLTHGHIDHIWSVAPVCAGSGIPAYIHPGDRALLSDPARGLWPQAGGAPLLAGLTFTEPDEVAELTDGAVLDLAGLTLTVDHAPGHTPGSVAFRLPPPADTASVLPASAVPAGGGVLFTGDLLFAGSIGRTDLPGGNYETILDSLARVCLPLPDDTVVLAGHGPQTTIGAERAGNRFLAGLAPRPGPGRGL